MSCRLLFAFALAALPLAGCAGDAGEAAETRPRGTDGLPPVTMAGLRFAGAETSVHEVVWANGTVNAQDTCNTGGCVSSTDRAMHRTDISDRVPAGTPTLLSVVLDWKESPVGFGGFDVLLEAPESTVYAHRATFQTGHLEAQAVLRPSGPVAVVMAAFGPGGDVPSTAYTLRIGVDADPEAVLPGVPVAVAMEGGDTLRARSFGGGDAKALLYAPDDTPLGLFDGERTLEANAPAGDYVVILPSGGPSGNLSTDSGAVSMRALPLRQEPGAEASIAPSGATDITWDVGGVPLAVGFTVRSGDDLVVIPMMASVGLMVRLEGPNGYVLDAGEVCGFCLTSGFWFSHDGGTGDPLVAAGAYRLHAEAQAAAGVLVQPFAVYVDREAP